MSQISCRVVTSRLGADGVSGLRDIEDLISHGYRVESSCGTEGSIVTVLRREVQDPPKIPDVPEKLSRQLAKVANLPQMLARTTSVDSGVLLAAIEVLKKVGM